MIALVLLGATVAGLLLVAGFLHLMRGMLGARFAEAMCRAPGLDGVIFVLTVLPQLVGIGVGLARHAGLWGTLGYLAVAVLGQCVAMIVWMRVHEWAHPQASAGPRITKTLNRAVGPWRNTAAVWWTAWAVPLFAVVRAAELTIYPPLTWLVRLPKYDHAQWVRVSRQKYDGLVGADRIWCLYCDWMTGVWSLGSEMLRNVESFWCPIRFASPQKCDNCKVDFPDIEGGWVAADGTMADVTAVLESKYPGPNGQNAWYGHPARVSVTVEGHTPAGGADEAVPPPPSA